MKLKTRFDVFCEVYYDDIIKIMFHEYNIGFEKSKNMNSFEKQQIFNEIALKLFKAATPSQIEEIDKKVEETNKLLKVEETNKLLIEYEDECKEIRKTIEQKRIETPEQQEKARENAAWIKKNIKLEDEDEQLDQESGLEKLHIWHFRY